MRRALVSASLIALLVLTRAESPADTDSSSVDDDEAKKYLVQFGYLQPDANEHGVPLPKGYPESNSNGLQTSTSENTAVRNFQRFAGMEPSGILDDQTRKMMAKPRCGTRDIPASSMQHLKWDLDELTYKVQLYSSALEKTEIDSAMQQAFQTWAKIVPLRFTQMRDEDGEANLRIGFYTWVHGDVAPFDGRGKTLAHAFFPADGKIHFDNSEMWSIKDARKMASQYTDLLYVAIHEIGHALGLEHIRGSTGAIMAPIYAPPMDEYGNYEVPTLSTADITAIQDLYGARSSEPTPTTTEYTPYFYRTSSTSTLEPQTDQSLAPTSAGDDTEAVEECPLSIDAIAEGMHRRHYVFDGRRVYELKGTEVAKVHSLDQIFPHMPPNIKAAISENSGRHIWLVDEHKAYEYRWNPLLRRYRLDLDSPKTLPQGVELKANGGIRWASEEGLPFPTSHVVCSIKVDESLCVADGDMIRFRDVISCRYEGLDH